MNPLQDVFISYGRADSKQFAKRLNDRLVMLGHSVWFDFDDIPLGVDYQKQIDDGIDKADNFLFLISPHSVNSPYCRLELELALKRKKRIIPLLHVEEIDRETWQQRNPKGNDAQWEAYKAAGKHSSFPNMHHEIGKINWVYFRQGIDNLEQSLQGLHELLERQKDYVHQHTVFLNNAIEWKHNQKQLPYLLVGKERQQAEAWLSTRFTDEQPPCQPTDLHCEFITESIKNANNLMTQVFLAHSEKDRDITERLRRTLMREGITTWIHHNDIKIGADFQAAMAQGVEEADNVLFLMSPSSLESPYCQQELALAASLNKRIIVLLVKPVKQNQVPASLKNLQYIDLSDNGNSDEEYLRDTGELLRALKTEATYYNEHKVLLTKALNWARQNRNPCILLQGYELQHALAWLKVAEQHKTHSPITLQTKFVRESERQPSGMARDVFVSYSRTNSGFARKLNDALQRQGKRTWFDQESIASGADFQLEINRGIEESHHFLFVISPDAIESPYCADEVEYAAKLNKSIITVLHRSVDSQRLHPELAKVQWIDFNAHDKDFGANFKELVRTLDTDPTYLKEHTRLLVRALEWEGEDRRESLLLRGDNLEKAEAWLGDSEGKEPQPTELQREYVATSRTLEDAKHQATQILKKAATKGKQRVLVGTCVMLLGVFLGGGTAFWAQRQVESAWTQVTSANEARKQADKAREQAESDVEEAQAQVKESLQALEAATGLSEESETARQKALASLKEAEGNLEDTNEKLSTISSEAEVAWREANEAKLLAQQNEKDADALRQMIAQADAQNMSLTEYAEQLEWLLQDEENRNVDLSQELAQLDANLTQEKNTNLDLSTQNAHLRQMLTQAEGNLAQATNENIDLSTRIDKLTTDNGKLRQNLSQLEASLVQIQNENLALSNKNAQLTAGNATLQTPSQSSTP